MLIYRVENPIDGDGPYIHGNRTYINPEQYSINGTHSDYKHPGMWEDCGGQYLYSNSFYCGFSSIEQFIDWFDGWYQILEENGFIVYIYEAKEYKEGKYQTIFNKNTATVLRTVSFANLSNEI